MLIHADWTKQLSLVSQRNFERPDVRDGYTARPQVARQQVFPLRLSLIASEHD